MIYVAQDSTCLLARTVVPKSYLDFGNPVNLCLGGGEGKAACSPRSGEGIFNSSGDQFLYRRSGHQQPPLQVFWQLKTAETRGGWGKPCFHSKT